MKKAECYSPFILQLQLQLEALDLHFSLSVVFQDFRIWFAVLWGSNVPSVSPILRTLLRTKGRHVSDHITIGSTVQHMKNCCGIMNGSDTNLPRGVVRPIPLYIFTLGERRTRRWLSLQSRSPCHIHWMIESSLRHCKFGACASVRVHLIRGERSGRVTLWHYQTRTWIIAEKHEIRIYRTNKTERE